MRRLALLATVAALAQTAGLPARADPAADFAAAAAIFRPVEPSRSAWAYETQLAMIPRLTGTWVWGEHLFYPAYDPDLHVRWCAREPARIEAAGTNGFHLVQTRNGREMRTHYASAGGWHFLRHTDPDAALPFHFGDRLATTDPAMLSITLASAAHLNGPVILHHTAPDILVIEAVGQPAQILVRCPG